MKTILIILSASILTLIQQEKGWPEAEKIAFINSCVESAKTNMDEEKALDYCSCMLEKVIVKYPIPEESIKMTAEEGQKMALECLHQDSNQKGWPEIEKTAFIESCVNNAKASVGEEKALDYCSCMLEKIMQVYPIPAESIKMTAEEAKIMAADCLE